MYIASGKQPMAVHGSPCSCMPAANGGQPTCRHQIATCYERGRRFYATDPELRRLFKSVNGLIFPGGLTDLYIDDPYVIAAKKLHSWAVEANNAGEVSMPNMTYSHLKGGSSAAVMMLCI